ncbi:MAG TPA: hypothetical protein VKX45_26140 [Bryobacteraceae bacterium]|nr:hypothetical protein [Bryobacteraceae bacterium]
MAEDLYEAPRAAISQGDILATLPNAHLVPPLCALFDRGDGTLQAEPDTHPDFKDKGQRVIASCRRAKALLLTYDCEIDKPKAENWIILPIVPLSVIPGGSHSDIKKNKVFSLLYLPKHRDILVEDSVVVLNHSTTLNKQFVQEATRILSLSDTGRRALYAQYIRWLTRWQLAEIRCPHCTATFNAMDGMTVRPD